MAEFEPAVEIVLRNEAGFQKDPHDPGNWTGGLDESGKGVGELKGTNLGISARSYPHEDIENMTPERAKEIYFRDFWANGNYGYIQDQDVANKVLDLAVNMERFGRRGPAIEILQNAVNGYWTFMDKPNNLVQVDGIMGVKTISAVNSIEGAILLRLIKSYARFHYQDLVKANPKLARFLPGWTVRVNS